MKTHNKKITRRELRMAIVRIERVRPKRIPKDRCVMNISTVAKEAGFTPALIHNQYPDIADAIRSKANRTSDDRRRERLEEIRQLKSAGSELRKIIAQMQSDMTALASENARLVSENLMLSAAAKKAEVSALR